MAAESDLEEMGTALASITSNNATASLPTPEEAALQEAWLEVFRLTSDAPLASSATLPITPSGYPQPPPSPRSYRAPRSFSKPSNGPPTPGPSETRKKPRKHDHWRLRPQELHQGIYEAMRCHSADWWISYYLRANNLDVDAAMNDLLKHVHWRRRLAHVDSEILPAGEAGALRTVRDPNADPREKKICEGFLSVLEKYTAQILRHKDNLGRIIGFVRVKNHKLGVYPAESYERYAAWHVEISRMMMPETRGDGILLFDLHDYKVHNMDYRPLYSIITIMKDFYPQGLGDVVLHRMPLLFRGVWQLAKTVIREDYHSHIHLTQTVADLEQFIPFESIPAEIGGGDETPWHYEHPDLDDPVNGGGGEEAQLTREYERTVLQEQYMETARLFEETTKEWIDASRKGRDARGLQLLRKKYQKDLLRLYWQLDPYLRSRTIYDILGWIQKPDFESDEWKHIS